MDVTQEGEEGVVDVTQEGEEGVVDVTQEGEEPPSAEAVGAP